MPLAAKQQLVPLAGLRYRGTVFIPAAYQNHCNRLVNNASLRSTQSLVPQVRSVHVHAKDTNFVHSTFHSFRVLTILLMYVEASSPTTQAYIPVLERHPCGHATGPFNS